MGEKKIKGHKRHISVDTLGNLQTKHKNVCYYHIHENDQLDEELLTSWIRQASELPGDSMF